MKLLSYTLALVIGALLAISLPTPAAKQPQTVVQPKYVVQLVQVESGDKVTLVCATIPEVDKVQPK